MLHRLLASCCSLLAFAGTASAFQEVSRDDQLVGNIAFTRTEIGYTNALGDVSGVYFIEWRDGENTFTYVSADEIIGSASGNPDAIVDTRCDAEGCRPAIVIQSTPATETLAFFVHNFPEPPPLPMNFRVLQYLAANLDQDGNPLGEPDGYLLIRYEAIPEPATAALLALGVAALGAHRASRQRPNVSTKRWRSVVPADF